MDPTPKLGGWEKHLVKYVQNIVWTRLIGLMTQNAKTMDPSGLITPLGSIQITLRL